MRQNSGKTAMKRSLLVLSTIALLWSTFAHARYEEQRHGKEMLQKLCARCHSVGNYSIENVSQFMSDQQWRELILGVAIAYRACWVCPLPFAVVVGDANGREIEGDRSKHVLKHIAVRIRIP